MNDQRGHHRPAADMAAPRSAGPGRRGEQQHPPAQPAPDRRAGLGVPHLGRRRHRVHRLPARPGPQLPRLRAAAGRREGPRRTAPRGHLRRDPHPGDRGRRAGAVRPRLGRDHALRQLQHGNGAGGPAHGAGRHRPHSRPEVRRPLSRLGRQHLQPERGLGSRPGQQRPARVITIEWNDAAAVEQVMAGQGDQIAAVIMEPIMLNAGVIAPGPGYLETVRRVCQQRGAVLVFDETISGFRVALGGAAERYGVYPDLAIYGKAMAAGWPCAAIAGRRDLFADVATGAVTHAGTFNGNTIATAAVLASIDELASGDVHEHVEKTGTALMELIRDRAAASQLNLHLQGLPMAFHASFAAFSEPMTRYQQVQGSDAGRYGRLADTLIGQGIWVARRGIWYVSAAHTAADISETADRIDSAFQIFTAAGRAS